MYDLGRDQQTYTKIVFDAVSGREFELYHRAPTTSEEVEFHRRTFRRRDRRNLSPEDIARNLAELRVEFGLKIVTGFKDGDFGVDGKPIASDPNSPNYYAGWKELLRDRAPRILSALAVAVFEGARVQPAEDEEDPFSENSADS